MLCIRCAGYCYRLSSVIGMCLCIAWCAYVCVSVVHVCEPSKNSWTDRGAVAVFEADSCEPKEPCIRCVKGRLIHSPPEGVTRRQCGLWSEYFEHLLELLIPHCKPISRSPTIRDDTRRQEMSSDVVTVVCRRLVAQVGACATSSRRVILYTWAYL